MSANITKPRSGTWRLLTTLCLTLLLATCSSMSPHLNDSTASDVRGFTILHINDVYRIDGVNDGRDGSLARLRTLRTQLERLHGPVLLTHGGDFLFPSLLSREFDGAQMIDMMNQLDGAPDKADPYMFAVFGNHEFDKGRLDQAGMLQRRLDESEFHWLDSNITWLRDDNETPYIDAGTLSTHLLDMGGIKVGLFGITTKKVVPEYAEINSDYTRVAATRTRELREQGAELVVAITHLKAKEDASILRDLGPAGPDLILGGHDHHRYAIEVNGKYVLKADADARSAVVARFSRSAADSFEFSHRFQSLDSSIAPDAELAARAANWHQKFKHVFCTAAQQAADCLDITIGKTAVNLIAEEDYIRRFETNLGNFLAGLALEQFAPLGADIALLNSGSMRINQDIAAGTTLTRRHLVELFPYPAELKLFRITGRELQAALDHSVEDWTGNGWWLQIAGLSYIHDPITARALQPTLVKGDQRIPIAPDDEILAVTSDYLLNPKFGQDGYHMFDPNRIVDTPETLPGLDKLFEQAIRDAGTVGIAPVQDGRICNTQRRNMPCLLADKRLHPGKN